MFATIRTDATIDRRGITATTELELCIDDMAQIGPKFERELRGQHVEMLAQMIQERREERRQDQLQKRRSRSKRAIATKRRAATP